MRKKILLPLGVAAALLAPAWGLAQDGGTAGTGATGSGNAGGETRRGEDGGRGRDRGERGERGERGPGGNPGQWRERMATMLKERLGATDDEWKVLEPKVEKVGNARRDLTMGGMVGMMGGRGPGGPGGPGGPRGGGPDGGAAASPLAQASRDLSTALENKDAPAADITQKLSAFRAARKKAQDDLAAAQKDLQGVVTPRQEAVLVSMGMLD